MVGCKLVYAKFFKGEGRENVKEIIHSVNDTIEVIKFNNLNSINNARYYFHKKIV